MRVNIDGVVGEITTFPGNSDIAVSHGVYNTGKRGQGIGTKAHVKRLDMLRDLGYKYVLCTVDAKNTTQQNILAKNYWHRLNILESDRTGNEIWLYGRHIYE